MRPYCAVADANTDIVHHQHHDHQSELQCRPADAHSCMQRLVVDDVGGYVDAGLLHLSL